MKAFTIVPGAPPVEFLTLKELAKACGGRSRYAFEELMDRGIIPDANFRSPSRLIQRGDNMGQEVRGSRLYSKDFLVPKLVTIFKDIAQGKPITPQQRMDIATAFQEEKEFYTTQYGK
jgi:hypothetical protein